MTYRHGSLFIMESPRSRDEINVELRKLDERLFLERQMTLSNESVWCVVCDVGSGVVPMTIYEWRDPDGNPIAEPSMGIVDRISRMERDGSKLVARVVKQNSDLIESKRNTTHHAYSEIGSDFQRLMAPGHSAVLPRGQHLRQSRDKRRSRGEKV